MTRAAFVRALLRELPGLVAQGVVNADTAARLRAHYAEPRGAVRLATVAFGVLGALLVGGGLILVVAHNWEGLTRHARAAVSFAPLIVCQTLALWVVLSANAGRAWREGLGVGYHLAVAAAIALVSQTYHLGGTTVDFLWGWSLLALPIAYLLNSAAGAALWLVTVAAWQVGAVVERAPFQPAYWGLLGAMAPYVLGLFRTQRYGSRAALVGWAAAVALLAGSLVGCRFLRTGLWYVYVPAVAAALYLAGRRWFADAPTLWLRPFHVLGALGVSATVFVLSFRDVWRAIGESPFFPYDPDWYPRYGYALAAAVLLAWALLLAATLRRRDFGALALGGAPVVAPAARALLPNLAAPASAAVVVNLYGLAVGVWIICDAARVRSLETLNGGMCLLAGLVLLRFFDSDLGILVRAVGFLAVGVAFLGANLWMVRATREGGA